MATINGTSGNDSKVGTSAADIMNGLGGNANADITYTVDKVGLVEGVDWFFT